MELTKKEQEILKNCRREGSFYATISFPNPGLFFLLLGIAVVVSVFIPGNVFRVLLPVSILIGASNIAIKQHLSASKTLINKLADRIEELEKKK